MLASIYRKCRANAWLATVWKIFCFTCSHCQVYKSETIPTVIAFEYLLLSYFVVSMNSELFACIGVFSVRANYFSNRRIRIVKVRVTLLFASCLTIISSRTPDLCLQVLHLQTPLLPCIHNNYLHCELILCSHLLCFSSSASRVFELRMLPRVHRTCV